VTRRPPLWFRDLLAIPLVVGLILATVAVAIDNFTSEEAELSYSVEGPTSLVGRSTLQGLEVAVNGAPVEELVGYQVRIWNSGDKPLRSVPVRVVFTPETNGFQILSVTHRTTPEYEFGAIVESQDGTQARRFVYELMNPNDEDKVTLLANAELDIALFAKSEGVSIREAKERTNATFISRFGPVAAGIVGLIASTIAMALSWLRRREESTEELQRLERAVFELMKMRVGTSKERSE